MLTAVRPTLMLSLVIPVGAHDAAHLARLLASLDQQDFPKASLETLLIREGNSEEAKAIGIRQAQGEVIGMLCTDNVFTSSTFLSEMVDAARQPGVVGAYPSHYAYRRQDTLLNRYFALLGANDPLCWWLGKADRQGYYSDSKFGTTQFAKSIPSLGDNGFFIKSSLAKSILTTPDRFGSCMDMCEDLRRQGHATYAITPNTLWHRTGESWTMYVRKRWRYTQTLYWAKRGMRRWQMVDGWRDWVGCLSFASVSLLGMPHFVLALCGYTRIRDLAWFLHPLVCLLLTGLYAAAMLTHGCRWWCARISVLKHIKPWSTA